MNVLQWYDSYSKWIRQKKIKDFINDKIEKYFISLPVFYLISDYVSHESLKEFRKMSSILKI